MGKSSKNMSTPLYFIPHPDEPKERQESVGDCWECLARLLAERGFRLSRGTWIPRKGESAPTVCIDRPENPEWGQMWAPWYAHKQHATDAAGEAQAALALAGEAIAKWDLHAFEFPMPNVEAHRARSL